MKVWSDLYGALWQGHVLDALAQLPAESVQCVVTSPPYWGLRAYGTEPQIWGGSDPDCDHALVEAPGRSPMTGGGGPTSAKQVSNAGSQFGNAWASHAPIKQQGNRAENGAPGFRNGTAYTDHQRDDDYQASATCTRCGAWRGELGSESRHDCAGWATGQPCGACYVCHMVAVFRAVRRVLRPDGVLFCNLGDSYNGSGKGGNSGPTIILQKPYERQGFDGQLSAAPGLKPKDLVGIPWRVAFALQADGWWLRSDIIWSKPNPMPESVQDRPTRSHEYIFMFTRAASYYWDADAVREAYKPESLGRYAYSLDATAPTSRQPGGDIERRKREAGIRDPNPAGRNARSVWTIPTHAEPAAHFATYPPALVRRCIQAGTSERGACATCGSPWGRVTAREAVPHAGTNPTPEYARSGRPLRGPSDTVARAINDVAIQTTGWTPTCPCPPADPVPQICLDPFAGSGTTLLVARQMGRVGWGIELNGDYCDLGIQRLQQLVLL